MKLLIIEDDFNVAQHLAALSEACGHQVCAITADADEAFCLALREEPNLVIADIDLAGGGDGIEAAVHIREALNVRTIFLTGSCDAATRDRAQHAWPMGFLAKPIDGPTFQQKLAGVVSILESSFARDLLKPSPAAGVI